MMTKAVLAATKELGLELGLGLGFDSRTIARIWVPYPCYSEIGDWKTRSTY